MIEEEGLDRERMVILSLKPRFAEAILTGSKMVELRRTTPRIKVPTRALLYATTPVRALLGTCVVTDVLVDDVATLWRNYGSQSALVSSEFQRYFEGLAVGTALLLKQPQPFTKGMPLQDLRSQPSGFRPPQSFAYIAAGAGNRLLQLAA